MGTNSPSTAATRQEPGACGSGGSSAISPRAIRHRPSTRSTRSANGLAVRRQITRWSVCSIGLWGSPSLRRMSISGMTSPRTLITPSMNGAVLGNGVGRTARIISRVMAVGKPKPRSAILKVKSSSGSEEIAFILPAEVGYGNISGPTRSSERQPAPRMPARMVQLSRRVLTAYNFISRIPQHSSRWRLYLCPGRKITRIQSPRSLHANRVNSVDDQLGCTLQPVRHPRKGFTYTSNKRTCGRQKRKILQGFSKESCFS